MPGTAYSQGDIILIPFPFTDNINTKVRPAIIISGSIVNKSDDVICVQITSKAYKDRYTFEISDKDVTQKLGGYNEVRCHKIFTLEKKLIRKKISHLHRTSFPKLIGIVFNCLKQES
ncbi:MAG: type II toxin-antitoxin system PemK/MazF family toxin [Sphingobacteriales bacterium]|nr:MAG: type II toxin-antitoxin system PemK/MazF family toxin [Sphingobacteriales bacterium]